MFNDPISDLNVTLMCLAIGCVPERKTMLSWSRSLGIVSLVLLFSANTAAKAKTPTISLAQAQAKALALHPGEIKSMELEKEHGRQIYSFDIKTEDGIQEVNVDSETGNIVEDSKESPSAEVKEGAGKKEPK
jgi:Peptidase propeptide and YPEB domain